MATSGLLSCVDPDGAAYWNDTVAPRLRELLAKGGDGDGETASRLDEVEASLAVVGSVPLRRGGRVSVASAVETAAPSREGRKRRRGDDDPANDAAEQEAIDAIRMASRSVGVVAPW